MQEVKKHKVGEFWVWTCPECGHDNVQRKGVRVVVGTCKKCFELLRISDANDET